MRNPGHSAFTLSELLVVVVVVAILAAIALPNFLEAQTRAKVSRAKADLATLATALEAYMVDYARAPSGPSGIGGTGDLLRLTRPVAYLSSLPSDPFHYLDSNQPYSHFAGGSVLPVALERFGAWHLSSMGPDRAPDTTFTTTLNYDPTNGTLSRGDVVRSQKRSETP